MAAAANLSITLQRRVLNVVYDAGRQAAMHTFLGMGRAKVSGWL